MAYSKVLSSETLTRLLAWWHWLDDNRGDRAELRRAESPEDILLTPAFSHFLQQMPEDWDDSKKIQIQDAAMVAAVLARVKTAESNKKTTFATALAKPKEKRGKAAMSELRFQQLQKSRTPDDFFRRVCRAVALLNGKANIACLADDVLHWLQEHRYGPASKAQDRLAVRWASDYYAAFKE
ncbi:MAG: type I-E CRISPR-associated protein Cse2/CasB [Candidatus Endonucleobacter sp. (ex Gigantidas childressi)]|nr:type I-E CRISPR-associated protein Cse2/CasB [Candidatus Endonucleobacter sp. (ex Gigantidas childressi)]